MDPIKKFEKEIEENIEHLASDEVLSKLSFEWMLRSGATGNYSYNFQWLGRPIIQYPQDLVAMQELVWKVKPELIIETGIAHGGSLIMNASYLAILEYCEAIEKGTMIDPKKPKRKVLGIDIDIRNHNRKAIESHPMSNRIDMIQGSSIDTDIIKKVRDYALGFKRILVCLDSNHTHEHVLKELEAYAPLTSVESYCIVYDTAIESTPEALCSDRQWGPGNSPKTAVWEYLKNHPEFEIDKSIQNKLQITVAPDGYLRRVS